MQVTSTPAWSDLREHLEALHRAALASADPAEAVYRHLALEPSALRVGAHRVSLDPGAQVHVVALGKASVAMARAAAITLAPRFAGGVVAHPRGVGLGGDWPAGLAAIEGGHPEPDEGSLEAGRAVEQLAAELAPADVVLALISGGGSAIMELPPPGIELETLREITRALQHAGADVNELNTVRSAMSRLKGGGLARLVAPARVVALVLSDVMGDDPAVIASGPVTPSKTGVAEARRVLEQRGLAGRFDQVLAILPAGAYPAIPAAIMVVVGSNRGAAEAVHERAGALGFRAMVLTDRLQGEAREVGRVVGGFARSARESHLPLAPPVCLVLGGETTVTVRGGGRGGRNHELALGAALALDSCPRAAVFSFATDGADGSSGAAGAIVTGETLARARARGLSPRDALAANDTGSFFAAMGDAWVTGPSGTNVNDLAIVLVYP